MAEITFDGLTPGQGLEPATGIVSNLFALHHILSPLFKPWQLVTHLFMHGSLIHILFNMLALWMFGSILENLWGPKRFLLFYILCGIGAAVLHLGSLWYENLPLINDLKAFKLHPSLEAYVNFFNKYGVVGGPGGNSIIKLADNWHSDPENTRYAGEAIVAVTDYTNASLSTPTVGASGAVFGCLAAFGYLFPNMPMMFVFFPVPIKAKWLVLGYIAFELFSTWRNSAGDNIAHVAHLGGALVGFLLVFFWNRTNRRQFY